MPVPNRRYFLRVTRQTSPAHNISQESHLRLHEGTLFSLQLQAKITQSTQYLLQASQGFGNGCSEGNNIIKVDQTLRPPHPAQHPVHKAFKGGRCIARNWNRPSFVTNTAFRLASVDIATCQYPLAKSIVENHCWLPNNRNESSMRGRG